MDGSGKGETDQLSDQLITIELFGQSYTFKAESRARMAKEVADFLVREVKKVETQLAGTQATAQKNTILILAALNIANENFELKRNHSDLLESISERSTKLIYTLDTVTQCA